MTVNINKGTALSSINLTPMIDMVFLLLIFFLVATRFEEEERSLEVQLPQASEAMPLTAKPREMFVNINEKGQYFLGSQPVTLPQLEQALEQAAANNPGRQAVIIRADKRCPVEFAVQAVNACYKAGIRDHKFTTAAPEE
jgi:biopolymer transport protein ExbD